MWGQPGAGGINLPPESGLAGGGGPVLAADIWRIRKRVASSSCPSCLLAGVLGLGSGDTEYQLATLALLWLDLPSPVLLRKQTHSSAERGTQCTAHQGSSVLWHPSAVGDTARFQGGMQVPAFSRQRLPRLPRTSLCLRGEEYVLRRSFD